MKKYICLIVALFLLLAGCNSNGTSSTPSSAPQNSESSLHSELFVERVSPSKIVGYFNEVAYTSEYSENIKGLTKWVDPIMFMVHGNPTSQDLMIINEFVDFLNSIDGFPGIMQINDKSQAKLNLYFYTQDEINNAISDRTNGEAVQGLSTCWHNKDGIVYEAEAYIATNIGQTQRNSVILEEFYHSMGLTNDTTLRDDSILYKFGDPEKLANTDKVIMKILYNADIKPNMSSDESEAIIRKLYY